MKIITLGRELKNRTLVDIKPNIIVSDTYSKGFEWASKIKELPELKRQFSTVYIDEANKK